MGLTVELEFDHDDRRDIYGYVERHGSVRPGRARRALEMEPRAFGHHVAILKRDGVLLESEGELRIAYEDEVEEEFRSDGVQVTIRRAREEDLTGLVGVIRQAIGDGTYVDAETVADIVDHEEVLFRHNELQSRVFFVATVDGDVVGWVNINTHETEKLDHTAELTVGVLDEYRGHGIGSELLERGLEWAETNGYEKIYNSVPDSNEAAIEFLKAHGWEVEAVREDHYKYNGEYLDEVMLATTV
ncbi:GNAT family N-acetyltransferase [Halobacteriales archaeon QH_8_67_27]|nr:MAG: GNAT family N-acetyltransferase [Halobacteriales archaeon QH_8_67_27]